MRQKGFNPLKINLMNPQKSQSPIAEVIMSLQTIKQRIADKLTCDNDAMVFATLAIVAILVTLIIHPSLMVVTPAYSLGDVAVKNIKSPRDYYVEDTATTRANRENAAKTVLTVYDLDEAMADETVRRVREAFDKARKIISMYKAGETLQAGKKPQTMSQSLSNYKPEFKKILGIEISDASYKLLEKEEFSPVIPDFITQILQRILGNGVVANKEILLEDASKGIVLRGIESRSEEFVRSLRRFYSHAQAKTMVRVVGDPVLKDLNYNILNLIVDFTQKLVRPNITLNRLETENRRKEAVRKAKPVIFKVKAGEMLLREGERVTNQHLLKLQPLLDDKNKKQALTKSLGICFLLLFFLVIFHQVYFKSEPRGKETTKKFALVCIVFLAFFLIARLFWSLAITFPHEQMLTPFSSPAVFAMPLAAGAMILCLFMGLEVALPFAVVMAFCAATLFDNPFMAWAYFFLNSTMGAYWIKECRERNVFIKAGAKIGLLNMGLAAALCLYTGSPGLKAVLIDGMLGFVGGMTAGVLTAGIVPLVELAFGFATDIKLLELSNLDQPVLKRLMLEAPGTYHHSVIVGSMVEAAATTIGANPLLAKVCGYYHDIGKIKKPLYFIENQMGGKNKHDKLAPSMSALILIAHTRDGVEMAAKHKLGGPIKDAVQQHHGTSLISYFFEKAKQLRGEDAVSEDDFRYPGPKPQTKEAGLVMLADVVEAASHTLENPTPARIQGLVQRLINHVFSDGQLDECELTLKDLHQIAKSFNQILAGIYHHRVEYTESQTKGEGKKAGAGTNGQPAKNAKDRPEKNSDGGPGSLKRLGLS